MLAGESLLSKIEDPRDIRKLSLVELEDLVIELRQEVIRTVSETGGHLGASLGVIELTVALHYTFAAPSDSIIWDVGHQSYPHKILTGRKDKMGSLRKGGGISGFTSREESEYDVFGCGHSSTSISAGLGIDVSNRLSGKLREVVCVIGDGAMSAGLAYEAMNNAGSSNLIVILNDNSMSISRAVGSMSNYLGRLGISRKILKIDKLVSSLGNKFPEIQGMMRRTKKMGRSLLLQPTIFDELGFHYIGILDGHCVQTLCRALSNVKRHSSRPVLVHIKTEKGKGYAPAEASDEKFHGVSSYDIDTGKPISVVSIGKEVSSGKDKSTKSSSKGAASSYTEVFASTLVSLAESDSKIVAVTAAMLSGTGLKEFALKYGERFFDVGIAEQHAVTFCGGLATQGYRPFAAIYSTFLQRAYDSVVHDIAVQKLAVRFAIDRAGFVGADGATHAGSFDITYLGCLPNFVLLATSDANELVRMTKTAALYDEGPIAFRYPRGKVNDISKYFPNLDTNEEVLDIGKGRLICEGNDNIAIINFGARLEECCLAYEELRDEHNITITLADARFAKPIDSVLIRRLLDNHKWLISVEEGGIGGFSAQVREVYERYEKSSSCSLRSMYMVDKFIEHDTQQNQYKQSSLDASSIVSKVLTLVKS